jgi:hypothetical protein
MASLAAGLHAEDDGEGAAVRSALAAIEAVKGAVREAAAQAAGESEALIVAVADRLTDATVAVEHLGRQLEELARFRAERELNVEEVAAAAFARGAASRGLRAVS